MGGMFSVMSWSEKRKEIQKKSKGLQCVCTYELFLTCFSSHSENPTWTQSFVLMIVSKAAAERRRLSGLPH